VCLLAAAAFRDCSLRHLWRLFLDNMSGDGVRAERVYHEVVAVVVLW
jgi:hypothetical protein